ncbi:MAG: hypothetical protein QOE31_1448, partial [Solirubrobacteraceae bacterium]|nr:hypothetical protein [Solirubrobacteraceae bacterium]
VLVSQRRVAMRALAPRRLSADSDAQGFWVELRDASDEPLYRQTLHEPIREDLEVVADDGVSLARVPRENVAGRFSVVVPDLPAAHAVSFVGPADLFEEGAARTRELARFELQRDE